MQHNGCLGAWYSGEMPGHRVQQHWGVECRGDMQPLGAMAPAVVAAARVGRGAFSPQPLRSWRALIQEIQGELGLLS